MIAPSMKVLHATTLSFITTDAVLAKNANAKWQDMMDTSFNMISVDGDQSTNDVSMIIANGKAGGPPVDNDPAFWEGVRYVAQSWPNRLSSTARARPSSSRSTSATPRARGRREAARSIISSSLVKTAIFGADPNFGRILAALGNSDASFKLDEVKLMVSDDEISVTLFEKGGPTMVPASLDELNARKILSGKKVIIDLWLGVGHSMGEAWGCDLTYDYVKITVDYTT